MPAAEAGPGAVTFLVVAYHRPDVLAELLEGFSSTEDPIVTVVVNVEADPAVDEIGRRYGATVCQMEGNPGYGAAINAGMQAVRTDVVVFSNDDVHCLPQTVIGLADVVSTGTADVAAPRVLDDSGQVVRTIQAVPGFMTFITEWVLLPDQPVSGLGSYLNVQKWRLPEERQPVGAASAIMLATRAELLRATPLPETYFMYFEESEWFLHLGRQGQRVLYCPDLEITHLGGRDVINEFKSSMQARNAALFMKRRYGPAALAAYPLLVVWQARLLAAALVRWSTGRGPSSAVKARVTGLKTALASVRQLP